MIEAIAAGAGYTLRALLVLFRLLPGIVGPISVLAGVWLLSDWPVGHAIAVILAGLILWAVDLQIPGIRRGK